MKTNFKSVGSAQKYSAVSPAGRVRKREVQISVWFAKGMDRIYVPFHIMNTVHYVTIIQCTPPVVNKNGGSCIDIPGGFG